MAKCGDESFHLFTLHILLLKCEGYKFPRNPNAQTLELFCGTHFYGPLVIAFNLTDAPYALNHFIPSYLERIKELNLLKGKHYSQKTNSPKNTNLSAFKIENKIKTCPLEREISPNLENYLKTLEYEVFYMYRFKTIYCPQISVKHDWSHCVYAHKHNDYR